MMRAICILALLFALGPRTVGQDSTDEIVITLERTEGYGGVPRYKVTIHGDGSVEYEGKQFVRIAGKRERKIDASTVQSLVSGFEDIHYFELQDSYLTIKNEDGSETGFSDLPTTFTSISLGGRTKKVRDYIGAPEKLHTLEEKIDEAAGTKPWVTIDAASVHEEAHRGWDLKGLDARVLLVNAAATGDAETVKAFIEEGADVNASNESVEPIQTARGAAVVRLLVSAGANANARPPEGYSDPALNYAALSYDVDTVRELLKAGASVNGRSWDGSTALMKAAERGDPEIVSVLLRAGADATYADDNGSDAMTYVRNGLIENRSRISKPEPEEKFAKIRALLEAAGAARGLRTDEVGADAGLSGLGKYGVSSNHRD